MEAGTHCSMRPSATGLSLDGSEQLSPWGTGMSTGTKTASGPQRWACTQQLAVGRWEHEHPSSRDPHRQVVPQGPALTLQQVFTAATTDWSHGLVGPERSAPWYVPDAANHGRLVSATRCAMCAKVYMYTMVTIC
jgi:hypothetical protein